MKLSEIVDITAIVESLDTAFNVVKTKDTLLHKIFKIEETDPNILINVIISPFKGLKIYELSFTSADGSYSLLNSFGSKDALKIFGTLLKIATSFRDANIWYFAAKKDYDDDTDFQKRIGFYTRLAKRLERDYDLVLTSRVIRGDYIFILANKEVNTSDIVDFMTS